MALKTPVPVHTHYKQIPTAHVAKHDLCAAQCALKECVRDLLFSLGEVHCYRWESSFKGTEEAEFAK